MNRLKEKTHNLNKLNKKAFVAYLTAGYPTLKMTEKLVLLIEKNGADIIELGMPFSDPIADGPTIQYSSSEALKQGMTMNKFFNLIQKLRKKTQIPLVMMGYYNPIFQYGIKKFAKKAAKIGLDGVIIPDLPPEESKSLTLVLKEAGISQIFLISPVTDLDRIKMISRVSSGFIYYVCVTGVTGARNNIPAGYAQQVRKIKEVTKTPVYVGFGISTPSQVKSITRCADGVIIGSALIKIIQQSKNENNLFKEISSYTLKLNSLTY